MVSLEVIANMKTPLVKGETLSYSLRVKNGRCKEDTEKKCNKCKDMTFGNKKCYLNGRIL